MSKSLKTNTNWMKNKEQMKNEWRMVKNDVGIDHRSNSKAPQPHFLFFFLLLLTNFTKMLSIYEAGPFTSTPSRLCIGKKGWRLNNNSPRRASFFTPKFYGGLGEPGAWINPKMTLLPSPFGYFSVLLGNIEKPFVLCRNWCQATQFVKQESKC